MKPWKTSFCCTLKNWTDKVSRAVVSDIGHQYYKNEFAVIQLKLWKDFVALLRVRNEFVFANLHHRDKNDLILGSRCKYVHLKTL